MIADFKTNFFNGSSLKPAGEAFFRNVAQGAFYGELAQRFSALETVDYPVCAWGYCLMWHPNIDSPGAFSKVLIGAAEQEPDRIANFAVKALHDKLNREGIDVVNAAGDGPWKLSGDGTLMTLNTTNLPIIHKAVQQSVDNINDPSIMVSNLNMQPYFDRVWKFVPRLTETSKRQVVQWIGEYTRPDSAELEKSAIKILHAEVSALIKTLIKENKLKPA
jgi:hypothetical protein